MITSYNSDYVGTDAEPPEETPVMNKEEPAKEPPLLGNYQTCYICGKHHSQMDPKSFSSFKYTKAVVHKDDVEEYYANSFCSPCYKSILRDSPE